MNGKVLCIVLYSFIIVFIFPNDIYANSEPLHKEEQSFLEQFPMEHLEKEMESFKDSYGRYFSNDDIFNMPTTSDEKKTFHMKDIIHAMGMFLFQEWMEQRYILFVLFLLVILSALVQQIQSKQEQSAITLLTNYMIYIVTFGFMLHSFYTVCMYGKALIDQMNDWMIALLPLLLSVVALFGQVVTISFFQPIVIFLIYASSTIITRIIFPLLFLAATLHLISFLHETYQATQLAKLMKTISLYVLGVFCSLFFGVISVQTAVATINDGVAIKATKFMTSNFIPVIGRTMTEGVDTLLSAAMLAKNAIGIFGLTILLFILLFPMIKMFVIAFTYQIVAACLQPITPHQSIIRSLEWMSKYMYYILACTLVMASLYFITLLLFIVSTNLPLLVK